MALYFGVARSGFPEAAGLGDRYRLAPAEGTKAPRATKWGNGAPRAVARRTGKRSEAIQNKKIIYLS